MTVPSSGDLRSKRSALTLRHIVAMDVVLAALLSITIPILVHHGKSPALYAVIPVAWIVVVGVAPLLLETDRENRERALMQERGF